MPCPKSRWPLLLGGLCLLTILGLRFYQLDRMVVWHDEVYSIARVNGIEHRELVQAVFDGATHNPQELLRLQRLQPGRGLAETWQALLEHPEHGPLYYLTGWVVTHWIADPRIALRSASVALGLLLFPALFWLTRELFERRTAWLAVSLAAASPLLLLYAREARQYAFWLALVVAASAALLRALRRDTSAAWGVYAGLLILAFYTHLLTGQVILAHALFLLLFYYRQRDALLQVGKRALAAWTVTGIAFIPWTVVILTGLDALRQYTSWMGTEASSETLVHGWLAHLNRLFVDLPGFEVFWPCGVMLLLGLLVGFLRRAPTQARLLLGALMLVTVLVVVLPDLLLQGRRSLQVRYLLPLLLAVLLMLAWGLARGLQSARPLLRHGNLVLLLGILGAGIGSQLHLVQADSAWSKSFSEQNVDFARLINRTDHPLLIGSYHDVGTGEMLSLAYWLEPKVRIWMEHPEAPLSMPEEFTALFALTPSQRLRDKYARSYRFERFPGSWQWYVAVPLNAAAETTP